MKIGTLIAITIVLAAATGCGEKPLPAHETSDMIPARMTPVASAPAPEATNQTIAAQPVDAPAAGVAPTTGALATTESELPGIRAELTQLARASGGTVNMRFRVINESDESLSLYTWLDESYPHTVGGVHLVDPINKRKYFVIRDSENNCVCSRNIENIKAGQQAQFWAKFPAPPPEVTHVSVMIPHFIPIDDVALQ